MRFQNVCLEIVYVVHTLSIFVQCQMVKNGEHYQQSSILITLSTTLNILNTVNKQSEVCRLGGATAESQLHMSTSLPNPVQSQRRDCQEKIWDKIGEVMPHIADPPTGLGRTLQKTLLAICDVIWGGLLACCPNAERKDVTKTFLEMGGACLRQSTNTAVRRHCTDWYEI